MVYCSLLLVVLLFSCTLGCQSNLSLKRMQAKNPLSKNSPKSPTKMVDVWNTFAQTVPDGKPVRGIAGRIHFYNDDKKKHAVKVDGSMTVFVFDARQKDPAHAKPLKVFQFKPETLEKHYSFKKPLGHGYDFFLPFDSIDGEEKPLCVLARFDDTLEGTLVLSPPVNVLLKGSRSEPAIKQMLAQTPPTDEIKPVSFDAPSTPMEARKIESDRNVSTIVLNDHLTRRLAQAPPQPLDEPVPPLVLSKSIEQAGWTGDTSNPVPSTMQGMTPDYPNAEYPNQTF